MWSEKSEINEKKSEIQSRTKKNILVVISDQNDLDGRPDGPSPLVRLSWTTTMNYKH
jgi:hypothetical protein